MINQKGEAICTFCLSDKRCLMLIIKKMDEDKHYIKARCLVNVNHSTTKSKFAAELGPAQPRLAQIKMVFEI